MERFWAKVDKTSGHGPNGECWIWTASRMPAGYGRFCASKKDRWWELAHRFSWYLSNGTIPDGAYVCHRCDNPCCVNPDHLFIGTAKDNSQDMIAKGRHPVRPSSQSAEYSRRAYREHPERWRRGSDSAQSKLTEQSVIDMRRRYAAGETQQSIANAFGISQVHVSAIVRRTSWRHVA